MDYSQLAVSSIHTAAKFAPDFRGKYRLFDTIYKIARIPRHRDYVVRPRWSRCLVRANLGSLIERQMLCLGAYDPAEMKLMKDIISTGSTCIDVGANVGYYTLVMAETVGVHGHVVAIEPQDDIYERLSENCRCLKNVSILRCACGDSIKEGLLYSNDRDLSDNRNATMVKSSPGAHEVKVSIRTVDDIWSKELGCRHVELIKADIEGYELLMLHGAASTIAHSKPALFLEFNRVYAQMLGYEFKDVYDFVKSIGRYKAYVIRRGKLTDLSKSQVSDSVANLLFISR